MMNKSPRWHLTLTHTPSGIVVTRDSNHFRNQHLALDSAMRYLKSRISYTNIVAGDVKFEYDLPDDDTYPRELRNYKQNMPEVAGTPQELDKIGD